MTVASRSARLEARIHPDRLAVVRRAAEIQGRTLSDFVVAAAEAAALKAIGETHRIELSAGEQRAFVELLINPPPLAPAMKRAKAHHQRLLKAG